MFKQLGFVICVVVVAGGGAAQVAADQSCKPVVGSFEARVVPPPDCLAAFCTEGRVWGGLQGTYQFTMPARRSPRALARFISSPARVT